MAREATFVGFGFGAIQSGLFLYEAFRSGNVGRLVVAEVVPTVVEQVRTAGGTFALNIAHNDRIEHAQVGPVEMLLPSDEDDRQTLVDAVAEAQEIATAVPSVTFYKSSGAGSIHRVLADGLVKKVETDGPRAVVYAAENHNHAAELLEQAVMEAVPEDRREAVLEKVRFLNTVIGKMSQVVVGPEEIDRRGIAPMTADAERAFLVEAFNHILISKVDFPEPFARGIDVLIEKPDLLPFEEAKLYGHNATHALGGYLGALRGLQVVGQIREHPEILQTMRGAFLEESGGALIRKHAGVDDLFTEDGYREYAEDLLVRMTNPFLGDTIERVVRDPIRKLGWDDRLVGTLRVALSQGIRPGRYALGAAAALAVLDRSNLGRGKVTTETAERLWPDAPPEERARVIELIDEAFTRLTPQTNTECHH